MTRSGAFARLPAALLVGFVLALLPHVVGAQEPVPLGSGPSGLAAYGFGDWVGLIVRLGLVLLVVWGGIVAMRWYSRKMNGPGGSARHLQVLESRALGPNRALHLIRLGDRAVLIGVTQERINALLEIEDPAEVERLAAEFDEPSVPRPFASMLGGLGATLMRLRPAGSPVTDPREAQIEEVQRAIARARSEREEATELPR